MYFIFNYQNYFGNPEYIIIFAGKKDMVKHLFQPTGHSCGPTCIKMLVENSPSIEEICDICGTDWKVGTPPDRMKKGLDHLRVKYVEHISESNPYKSLRDVLDKGNYGIIRTIIGKVPHWILAVGYNSKYLTVSNFIIYDPIMGERLYNEKQLEKIWKVRDYYFLEIFIPYDIERRDNPNP